MRSVSGWRTVLDLKSYRILDGPRPGRRGKLQRLLIGSAGGGLRALQARSPAPGQLGLRPPSRRPGGQTPCRTPRLKVTQYRSDRVGLPPGPPSVTLVGPSGRQQPVLACIRRGCDGRSEGCLPVAIGAVRPRPPPCPRNRGRYVPSNRETPVWRSVCWQLLSRRFRCLDSTPSSPSLWHPS